MFVCVQAFPAISTGIYGYPIESATQVAFGEVRKFLETEQAKEACLVLVLGCYCYPILTAGTSSPLMGCVCLVQFERVIFVVFSAEDEAEYL